MYTIESRDAQILCQCSINLSSECFSSSSWGIRTSYLSTLAYLGIVGIAGSDLVAPISGSPLFGSSSQYKYDNLQT